MAYSELVILYSLIAILVLLRFYRRERSGDDQGPVRNRRKRGYGPAH